MADLLEREGRTFPLRERTVHLPDGRPIIALVPIYEGKRIIRYSNLRELAEMAIHARGTRGTGAEYVRNVAKHLEDAGVEDKVVSDLLVEIDRCLGEAAAKYGSFE